MSLIAYLRQTLRLPIKRIQAYLKSVHLLSISSGEIVELMHQLRQILVLFAIEVLPLAGLLICLVLQLDNKRCTGLLQLLAQESLALDVSAIIHTLPSQIESVE